jgi:nitrogen fixation-related uncharacterized protein
METLLSLYLIIGCVNSLIIWWATFQPDYDEFIREAYREEPPSTNQEIVAIISGVFIWPVHLYWILRS